MKNEMKKKRKKNEKKNENKMKKMKRVREKAPFGNFRGRRKEKMPKRKNIKKK